MTDTLVRPGSALVLEGVQENVTKRTAWSRTYPMPDGSHRLLATMAPVHYKDNLSDAAEEWKDIDLTIVDEGGKKAVHKTFFDLEIYTDRIGYRYASKQGGLIDVELVEIGGQPVNNDRFKVRTDGNQLFWDDVADGVDMKVQLRPQSAEIFKKLAGENAPRRFKWKISESAGSQASFRKKSAGVDNAKPKANILEMLNEVAPITDDSFYFEEEWTGRVAVRDRATRQKSWSYDAVYPVFIDAFTSEVVVANVDDGWEWAGSTTWNSANNAWYVAVTAGLNVLHGGVRFRTLGVPQGATINNAVLKFNVTAIAGVPQATIYGDDVNDAALWANGNLPSGITKTAGSSNWSATATGWNTIGVTSIVQTIISRAGWVSLNDVRFGVLNQAPATTRATAYVYDYNQGAVNPAVLDVTYTVAIPVKMATYRRRRTVSAPLGG